MIPEKLYGREREVEALLAAFDRVVASGAPELVLVSGYSGIGKSSVVNELHKALVPPRGLFATGKFDQLKRDIPYSTLVQAFQGLTRPLLSKSDAELARWREAILDALGPNGRLMTGLIPELTLISASSRQFPSSSRSRRNGASSSCSAASSASSQGRNIRWRSFSMIFNGWTLRRSTCSRIS